MEFESSLIVFIFSLWYRVFWPIFGFYNIVDVHGTVTTKLFDFFFSNEDNRRLWLEITFFLSSWKKKTNPSHFFRTKHFLILHTFSPKKLSQLWRGEERSKYNNFTRLTFSQKSFLNRNNALFDKKKKNI